MPAAVEVGRIRSLETFHDQYVCFVRLTTTLGQVGWGQTSTYNADITARIFHRQVAPWAGLDTALWDLHGRATGRPTARPARVWPSWWTPTAASLRARRSRSAGSSRRTASSISRNQPPREAQCCAPVSLSRGRQTTTTNRG